MLNRASFQKMCKHLTLKIIEISQKYKKKYVFIKKFYVHEESLIRKANFDLDMRRKKRD